MEMLCMRRMTHAKGVYAGCKGNATNGIDTTRRVAISSNRPLRVLCTNRSNTNF